MFVALAAAIRTRIRRVAARLRGVALLEALPVASASASRSIGTAASPVVRRPETATHGLVGQIRGVHPHRMALSAPTRPRRPSVPPKPAVCLTPLAQRAPSRRAPRHPGTADARTFPPGL
jgi:hypothetical protein